MNPQSLIHLIWIAPLALLVGYIGSPRFLGTVGTARVRRILNSGLEKRKYTVMHDLILPAGGGTLHFDHIVISRHGICVIDSIHRPGWISGTDVQARWQQKSLGRTHRFDNPVHANFIRTQSLERLLALPRSRFHPMVVFSGQSGFKSGVPDNAIEASKLLGRIRSKQQDLLTPVEADQAILCVRDSAIHPGLLGRAGRWKLLRLALLMVLLAAIYLVYHEQLINAFGEIQRQADVRMQPENFRRDGAPKTSAERYEDSLNCAYSVDLGRCSCYEPGGMKANIKDQKCQELAERGSVLQQ